MRIFSVMGVLSKEQSAALPATTGRAGKGKGTAEARAVVSPTPPFVPAKSGITVKRELIGKKMNANENLEKRKWLPLKNIFCTLSIVMLLTLQDVTSIPYLTNHVIQWTRIRSYSRQFQGSSVC